MTVVITSIEVKYEFDEADPRAEYVGDARHVSRKIGELPDKTRLAGGWIYGLQAWATARQIAVKFGADALDISVRLGRDELNVFLDEACDATNTHSLRAEIDAIDDREAHFTIYAHEF